MKRAWKKITGNKFLIVVLIALMLIPAIYTVIFLGSIWDPYGKMDKMPVAIVNEDKAVAMNGKEINVGRTLTKNLVKNKALDFRKDDMESARKKLKNGSYYMIVDIPENFSEHATTVLDETPKKATIHYYTNPAKSFMGAKFTESAMTQMKNAVSNEVTKNYADILVSVVKTSSSGIQKAADGSNTINDGVAKLEDGSNQVTTNLNKLSSSSLTFVSGSQKLNVGLKKYTDGVNSAADGAKTLNAGAGKLASGAETLKSGADKYVQGVNTYSNSVNQYVQGADQLSSGISQLKGLENLGQVSSAVNQISYNIDGKDNAGSLKAGADSLSAGLKQLSASANELTKSSASEDPVKTVSSQIDTFANGTAQAAENQANAQVKANADQANSAIDQAINAINASSLSDEEKTSLATALNSQKVSPASVSVDVSGAASAAKASLAKTADSLNQSRQALTTAASAISSASAGADKLDQGVTSLGNAMTQLSSSTASFPQAAEGVKKLSDGAEKLSANSSKLTDAGTTIQNSGSSLSQGISSVSDGAAQLASGTVKLQSGLDEISKNNDTLLSGQNQLTSGAGQISDGSAKLASGSKQVTDNLGKLQSGTTTLSKGLNDSAEKLSKQKVSRKTANMFATPVNAKETKVTNVKTNGYGMAPYMMSVGLWVVCIACCMIFPVGKHEDGLKNGMEWWTSNAVILYPTVLLSGFIMLGMLHLVLGFTPLHWGQMILSVCVTGLAFMSIFMFLNVALGVVGSYIGLIMTVIQLSASGGTYPLEISSHYAGYIHDYIPFTYTVDAFRGGIAGDTSISKDITFLAVAAVVFALLTILLYIHKDKKARKQPESQGELTLAAE